MLFNAVRGSFFVAAILLTISFVCSQSECGQVGASGVIPLVVGSGTNLTTCEVGLKYLREVLGDDYLYITVVVGPARQGKSFFLNTVAGEHPAHGDGFSVGHTPIGHTKGFWISPKHNGSRVPTKDGDVVSLFLDTEGFGAIGNLEAYDPKLCAMVSIFASNLFYNVMRSISMDDLKFISSIAVLDKYFQKSHGTSFSTPPLSWVLQSFELSLAEFTPPNELGYLKYILSRKSSEEKMDAGDKLQISNYNVLLDSILNKFNYENSTSPLDQRAVPPIVVLDRPSHVKMSQLPTLSFTEFSTDYQAQIELLRRQIRAGAVRKFLSPGIPLTGKTFADNVEILTQSMNKLVEVGDAYVRSVATQAARVTFHDYNETLHLLQSPSESQAHYHIEMTNARANSLRKFEKICVGKLEDVVNAEVKLQLDKEMNSEERVLVERNMNAEITRCQEMAIDYVNVLSSADISVCSRLCSKQDDHRAIAAGSDDIPSIENDAIALRECRDHLLMEYRRLCGVSWCDVVSPTRRACLRILNRTSVSFTMQLEDVYDSRMKSLATQGFAALTLAVFIAYPLLTVLACLGLHSEVISRLVTFLVFSMGFLSMLNGALWFRMVVCSESTVPVEGFSVQCNYWADELPKVIGIGFNAYVLPFLHNCRSLVIQVWDHCNHLHATVLRVARELVQLTAPLFIVQDERQRFLESSDHIVVWSTTAFLVGCCISVLITVKYIFSAIGIYKIYCRRVSTFHTKSTYTTRGGDMEHVKNTVKRPSDEPTIVTTPNTSVCSSISSELTEVQH